MVIRFRKDDRNGKIPNLFTLSLSILSKMAIFLLWQVHNGEGGENLHLLVFCGALISVSR